jgi:ABC-2 type transport system ATP-binding protein
VLEVEDVRKRYRGTVALDGVSLSIPAGRIMALLGPNGAGKTTLISIVSGLRRADSGSVRVGGNEITGRSTVSLRLIGLAPQETAVYPMVTVAENLRFVARITGLPRREREQRVAETADAFALGGLLGRRPELLSGGERRRLHAALACVHRPPLLLLDEPTAGVDVATRAHVLAAIRKLAADEGCAVCYSTHYLPEVAELDATVSIIHRGRVVAAGTPEALTSTGASYVRLRFDGAAPHAPALGGQAHGSTLIVPSGDPAPVIALLATENAAAMSRLLSMDIVRPSLESVLLSLTGESDSPSADERTGGQQ